MQPVFQAIRAFGDYLPVKIQKISPGLVLLKNLLSPSVQVELASKILQLGERSSQGFWKDQAGQRTLNSTHYRGRMFGPISDFPSSILESSQRGLRIAAAEDDKLQEIVPTHLLALFYQTIQEAPTNGYIPWHRDNGENDGSGDFPVISFTLGDSCDFLINDSKPIVSKGFSLANPSNLAHRVLFESGDVLIFGGPKRYMWHSVHKIHKQTAPEYLPFNAARINLTLRYAPEIIGEESRFKTVSADQINPYDNPFFKL